MRLLMLLLFAAPAFAEPCKSGPQPSQRPGPYSAQVAVGPQRGTQHCFICETMNRPAVIVFARDLSAPLGKLVHALDGQLAKHKSAELRAWVTFLADDASVWDPKVVDWGKKHNTGNVPLGIFSDKVGPPTYLLHHEAEVTVLVSVKQKVQANFAFRPGELDDAAIAEILKSVVKLAEAK